MKIKFDSKWAYLSYDNESQVVSKLYYAKKHMPSAAHTISWN